MDSTPEYEVEMPDDELDLKNKDQFTRPLVNGHIVRIITSDDYKLDHDGREHSAFEFWELFGEIHYGWTKEIFDIADPKALKDFSTFLQKKGILVDKVEDKDRAAMLAQLIVESPWVVREPYPKPSILPLHFPPLPAKQAPSASQSEVQNLKEMVKRHREDALRHRQEFRKLEGITNQQQQEIGELQGKVHSQEQEVGELHTMVQNLQSSVQYLFQQLQQQQQQQQPIRTTRLAPATPARFASPVAPSSNSTAPFSSPAAPSSTPTVKKPRACKKCNTMFPSGAKLYLHLPECQGQGLSTPNRSSVAE